MDDIVSFKQDVICVSVKEWLSSDTFKVLPQQVADLETAVEHLSLSLSLALKSLTVNVKTLSSNVKTLTTNVNKKIENMEKVSPKRAY